MAGNSASSSFKDPNVLMKDPFLDYINEVPMEEGMEDAICMQQQDADVSYRAIMSGFYEIIGEHSLPNSSVGFISSEENSDPHLPHQVISSYENGPDEKHVKVFEPNDGLIRVTDKGLKLGVPRVPLSANGNPHTSFQQGTAEVGFVKPGLVQESHVETAQIRGHHELKNAIYTPCYSLNSIGTLAQGHHGAIKLKNGGTIVSSWVEDVVVQALFNHTLYSGMDMSFEDLKLKSGYTALYVGEPSLLGTSTRASRGSRNGYEKKSSAVAHKSGRKSCNRGAADIQGFVDLSEVLVSCAEAVAVGDVRKANEILEELRQVQGVSEKGSGFQRAAHYFSEALVARMRGMGGYQFRAISQNVPSAVGPLRSSKIGFEVTPYLKILHYCANQSILKAAEGASRLHIVEYGLMDGMQWPCLINALADRKGGPPLLVITGIEFPQPGHNPAEKLMESGWGLAAYARTLNVPFQYHAIATSKWEDLDATSLHLHEDEVLVVNCMRRLRYLADESIDIGLTTSPRQKLLTSVHSLNPHLLLFADVSAAYNSPFFVSRFREALSFYSKTFDMLDTLWDDSLERLLMERCCFYRDILNIVACEGAERVERPETYRQWQRRIKRAGFEQLPIPPTILSRSKSHVKQHYHKDFFVHDDANGWMLLGWKGLARVAISVWRPSPV